MSVDTLRMPPAINLSDQVIGLYDPAHDPLGVRAWRELNFAAPEVQDAWLNHHFHWSIAWAEATRILRDKYRRTAGIEVELVNVTHPDSVTCIVEYKIIVRRKGTRSFVLCEDEFGDSFGAILFQLANARWLAGRIADEIDLREGEIRKEVSE